MPEGVVADDKNSMWMNFRAPAIAASIAGKVSLPFIRISTRLRIRRSAPLQACSILPMRNWSSAAFLNGEWSKLYFFAGRKSRLLRILCRSGPRTRYRTTPKTGTRMRTSIHNIVRSGFCPSIKMMKAIMME